MKILAIETSCDETGITILEAKGGAKTASFKVLANNISSQIAIHAPYGGVFPMLAKREHTKNLPILLEKSLKEARPLRERTSSQRGGARKAIRQQANMRGESAEGSGFIDLIVVTSGPGLEPALWTGIVFAKELGAKWQVPVLPVNHMQGHILSVLGKSKGSFKLKKIKAPILSLLVSGGHTELVLTKDFTKNKNKVLGATLDDAAGEAFDKVARMLGLPYPGGPEISKLAESLRATSPKGFSQVLGSPAGKPLRAQPDASKNLFGSGSFFPRPMMHSKNFDFSFSGLKTSVLYFTQKFKSLDTELKKKISLEFENAVVETLVHKTRKAANLHKAKTLIVAGGVAANKYLRKEIKKNFKDIPVFFPDPGLTTDNSLMIGIAGYLKYLQKGGKVGSGKNIKADGNLKL